MAVDGYWYNCIIERQFRRTDYWIYLCYPWQAHIFKANKHYKVKFLTSNWHRNVSLNNTYGSAEGIASLWHHVNGRNHTEAPVYLTVTIIPFTMNQRTPKQPVISGVESASGVTSQIYQLIGYTILALVKKCVHKNMWGHMWYSNFIRFSLSW